jgi:TolB-like protein/Tfp pilus assembly protein PilF
MAEERPSQQKVEDSPRSERLETWGEIASYLGREIRTVQRWEKSLGLPVRRLGGADKSRVFAFRHEIDAWWREHETRANSVEPEESTTSNVAVAEVPVPPDHYAAGATGGQRFFRRSALKWAALVAATVLLTVFVPKMVERLWPTRVVLAVQPFQNLGAREDDTIAAGLTEEMVARLGQVHPNRMLVLSQNAASSKVSSIGATYVLRGTIRHYGSQVAVTAQLIQTSNQTVVWGNSYERDVKDLLRVQAEVADAIASEVFIKLPHFGPPVREVNREAYLAYLEGRYFWGRRTAEDMLKATAAFEKSIRIDPTYAPAYAGLADCYELSGSAPYTIVPPKDAFPKAEATARKALELDPSLAEAHVSLGYAYLAYEWDIAAADREFRRAIELRTSYATGHQFYGYSLTATGKLTEAIAERKKAMELDPINPLMASALGEAYYQARQFDNTIALNQRALELDPTFAVALVNIGRAYQQKGMHPQAQAAFQKLLSVAPQDPAVLALLGHEYAVSGRRNDALQITAQLKGISAHRYVPALYFALISTGLGEKDEAFRWMDAAVRERTEYLVYLASEPLADPLRNDPRFPDLVKQVGISSGGH